MKDRYHKKWYALGALAVAVGYWLFPDRYPVLADSDHYQAETQRFFNPLPEQPLDNFGVIKNLWAMLTRPQDFAPLEPLPTVRPDFQAFLADSAWAKFIWFGHSTLLARVAGQTLFIDPVFAERVSPVPGMMKRFQAPPATLHELPEVDWILYSHNHYDHLDEAVVRHYAKLQKTRFLVPLAMGVLLKKWGVPAERIVELDWWQSHSLKGLTITAVPARHNAGRGVFDRNKTLWAGYVLQTAREQIYYSGDSSFGDGTHFAQIGERFGGFDLAFVENGQYDLAWIDNHMLPAQTAEAVKRLHARRFVPVHWGAYALAVHKWQAPVAASVPLVQQQGVQVITPLQGQVFDQQSQTPFWWQGRK